MTNLKHYHLGCGESLQSNWTELQRIIKTTYVVRTKAKWTSLPTKSKPGKQH
jgi:hypothetical protein